MSAEWNINNIVQELDTARARLAEVERELVRIETCYKQACDDRLQIWDERNTARAQIATLATALREIVEMDCHAGQGWCYAPHGTRACSCHISDARAALKAAGVGE